VRRCIFLLLAAALSRAAAAQGHVPGFDPSKLKGPASGTANEVLVLGSIHLSSLPPSFDPASLRLLHERLAGWRPHAIAVEDLSGVQCDFLRRYPQRYADTIESYCHDVAPAAAATGLDVPAATVRAEHLLAAWPASPSAAQRRHLAAVFLAGGELASALVQWLRLPVDERRAGDGLSQALVDSLTKQASARNESYLVAAIMKAWDNPATARRKQDDERLRRRLGSPEGLLALYRAINAPVQARLAFDSDFGAALEEPSPQRFGRNYLGYWETRKLRMAANIRAALGARPGTRMLVIVGASHKAYLEAYLHQMHDVRIVDSAPLLR
jgi:hypothetical protein